MNRYETLLPKAVTSLWDLWGFGSDPEGPVILPPPFLSAP